MTSNVNGNVIFLPAAGYRDNDFIDYAGVRGYYWASSLYDNYSDFARRVLLNSEGVYRTYEDRDCGQSVRPVTE